MKFIFLLSSFLLFSLCYAGTLVKYDKITGDIIQTNDGLKEIPLQEILNGRYISDITDVIFTEDKSVDITKKRVDINEKKLIDIPQTELDAKKQQAEAKQQKKEQNKQKAIDKLKALGLTEIEIKALIE